MGEDSGTSAGADLGGVVTPETMKRPGDLVRSRLSNILGIVLSVDEHGYATVLLPSKRVKVNYSPMLELVHRMEAPMGDALHAIYLVAGLAGVVRLAGNPAVEPELSVRQVLDVGGGVAADDIARLSTSDA